MKKLLIVVSLLALLLLDWAALDDITTGYEPDYIGEYAILIMSMPLIAGIVWYYFKTRNK